MLEWHRLAILEGTSLGVDGQIVVLHLEVDMVRIVHTLDLGNDLVLAGCLGEEGVHEGFFESVALLGWTGHSEWQVLTVQGLDVGLTVGAHGDRKADPLDIGIVPGFHIIKQLLQV